MNTTKQLMADRLLAGETIEDYRENGSSMTPIIYSRQPVTISPVNTDLLEKRDIVFCRIGQKFYLHLVTAVEEHQVQISNNKGFVNGYASKENVFGIVSAVDGKPRSSAQSKIRK